MLSNLAIILQDLPVSLKETFQSLANYIQEHRFFGTPWA